MRSKKRRTHVEKMSIGMLSMSTLMKYSTYSLNLWGPNNRLMERWGSLEITFPEYGCANFAQDLFVMLTGPTPRLTNLSLIGFGFFRDLDLTETSHLNPQAFHELTSLKRLRLSGVFEFPSLIPSTIEHLYIPLDLGTDDWIILSRFTSLRTLNILNRIGFDHGMQTEVTPLTLHMPFLQKISLSGTFPHLDVIKFDCPALNRAEFTIWPSQFEPIFPLFKPRIVRWELFGWAYGLEEGQAETMLTYILTQYRSITELQIPLFMEKAFLDLFTQLKGNGLAPPDLRLVSLLTLSRDIKDTIDLTAL